MESRNLPKLFLHRSPLPPCPSLSPSPTTTASRHHHHDFCENQMMFQVYASHKSTETESPAAANHDRRSWHCLSHWSSRAWARVPVNRIWWTCSVAAISYAFPQHSVVFFLSFSSVDPFSLNPFPNRLLTSFEPRALPLWPAQDRKRWRSREPSWNIGSWVAKAETGLGETVASRSRNRCVLVSPRSFYPPPIPFSPPPPPFLRHQRRGCT